MKRFFVKIMLRVIKKDLWIVCGNISLRFHDKGDGAYDDLQDKLYYWITSGLSV